MIKLKIKTKYERIKEHIINFRQRNWKDTSTLLYWTSLILFSFCVGIEAGSFLKPIWFGSFLVFLLTFCFLIIILWILEKILRILLRNGMKELLSCLLLCGISIIVLTGDAYIAGFVEIVIVSIGFSLIFILFLKSLWSFLYHKIHTRTILITIILTSIPIVAMLALLTGTGFSDSYVDTYLKLSGETERKEVTLSEQEQASFKKSMDYGSYTVLTATYGTTGTEDFASHTVNISRFVKNQGLNGFFKEKYQKYPLTEVPLSGIIWYPKEVSNCPTLFIIHGNHSWLTESYLGYAYLGTYLASHGYVVVSVNENACNGLSNENDGRAVLLLENIKQMENYNREKESPLYQKMDYQNLALAGHSRGGEAIATAYLFNDLNYYPDNGNRSFEYHFSIQSLIAIAPTCGQYHPSNREVELADVNYLLIHGANDQDVITFMGMEQYEDISFSGKKDCIKTSLYVAGLNHGQFNSLWGKYDFIEPMNRLLNVENFLSQQEQQQIAKIFIKTFLDTTINLKEKQREQVYNQNFIRNKKRTQIEAPADLLTNYQRYTEFLPETIYVQSYQTSGTYILCDFEEDSRIDTGTAKGVTIKANQVNSWYEDLMAFSSKESRDNYAVILKWSEKQQEKAEICFKIPNLNLSEKNLQLDIMDLQEDFSEQEAKLLEAEVIVTDREGKKASQLINDYTCIYPAFLVRLNKLQYVLHISEYKHQFQTVSIPISDFSGVNLQEIVEITLRFSEEKGKVAIDNIGIR